MTRSSTATVLFFALVAGVAMVHAGDATKQGSNPLTANLAHRNPSTPAIHPAMLHQRVDGKASGTIRASSKTGRTSLRASAAKESLKEDLHTTHATAHADRLAALQMAASVNFQPNTDAPAAAGPEASYGYAALCHSTYATRASYNWGLVAGAPSQNLAYLEAAVSCFPPSVTYNVSGGLCFAAYGNANDDIYWATDYTLAGAESTASGNCGSSCSFAIGYCNNQIPVITGYEWTAITCGYATGYDSNNCFGPTTGTSYYLAAQAMISALDNCEAQLGSGECYVRGATSTYYSTPCMAVAVNSAGSSSVQYGATHQDAVNSAVSKCNSVFGGCTWREWACA